MCSIGAEVITIAMTWNIRCVMASASSATTSEKAKLAQVA